MGEWRRPRSTRMRRFRGKSNSVYNPIDELTGIPTDPRFLGERHGFIVDIRRSSESNDSDDAFGSESPDSVAIPINESDAEE